MKVKRPWLVAPRRIEYRDEEIALTPDTLLVRHVCTAPSQGTAIHRYRAEEIGLASYDRNDQGGAFPYPWLQGFAYGVGMIEEVGDKVPQLKAGQLVYSQKLTSDLAVVRPKDVTPLPDGLDPEAAALLYQAEVALKGARAGEIVLGDTAFVSGQGPIGSFAAQLARLAGAHRLIVSDLSEQRLDIARAVGMDLALNPLTQDVFAEVARFTGGLGADVAIESSGSSKAFLQACQVAGMGAKIVVLGWILDACTFNMSDAFTPKGLEMVVCHSGQTGNWRLARRALRRRGMGPGVRVAQPPQPEAEDYAYLLGLMAEGRLRAKELITHRFPYKDLAEVWAEFVDKKPGEYVQVVFVS